MCKHILIATDGSPLADKALQYGIALAKRLNVPTTAVTVTEPWSALEMGRMARRGNQNPVTQFQEAAAAVAVDMRFAARADASSSNVAHLTSPF